MDNNKKIYFSNRNVNIAESDYRNRKILGEIEVKNFNFLINKFYSTEINEKRILDLGAGDKFLKNPFENYGCKYESLDIEELNFEIESFPFEDNSFDFIICLAVIEHLNSHYHFLQECKRVLKKDGLIFLSTPNWKYDYNNFYNDYTHVRPFTPKSLKDILYHNQFKKIYILPGLRNKPLWMYKFFFRFFLAKIIPFKGNARFVPNFLKGKATSLFALAKNSK